MDRGTRRFYEEVREREKRERIRDSRREFNPELGSTADGILFLTEVVVIGFFAIMSLKLIASGGAFIGIPMIVGLLLGLIRRWNHHWGK